MAKLYKITNLSIEDDGSLVAKIKHGIVELSIRLDSEDIASMIELASNNGHIAKQLSSTMTNAVRGEMLIGKKSRMRRAETITAIKEGIAAFFQTEWQLICKVSRQKLYIELRNMAYGYLSQDGYSLADIAALFIRKDRKTIHSGLKRHEALFETDKHYNAKYKALEGFMLQWMFDRGFADSNEYTSLEIPFADSMV